MNRIVWICHPVNTWRALDTAVLERASIIITNLKYISYTKRQDPINFMNLSLNLRNKNTRENKLFDIKYLSEEKKSGRFSAYAYINFNSKTRYSLHWFRSHMVKLQRPRHLLPKKASQLYMTDREKNEEFFFSDINFSLGNYRVAKFIFPQTKPKYWKINT